MIVDPITPKRRTAPRLLIWIIAIDTVVAAAAIYWFAIRTSRHGTPGNPLPPAAVAPPPAIAPGSPAMVAPPVVGHPPPPADREPAKTVATPPPTPQR